VSVIVLPRRGAEAEIEDIVKTVLDDIAGVPDDPQKPAKTLLTTHLHVVEPRFLTVEVKATITPLPDVEEAVAKAQVVEAVKSFFDPHTGGDERRGWPFGRNVFVSEVFSLLDQLSGIDFVAKREDVDVKTAAPGRTILNDASELIGLDVKPYELVKVQITEADVTVEPLNTEADVTV
jgi:hypothetical protein